MKKTIRSLSASMLALGLIAGCAQQGASDAPVETAEAPLVQLPVPATVKVGAAVEFSHEVTAAAGPGGTGTLSLKVIEGYGDGTLTLETYGDDALSVFGADTTKTVDMSAGDVHEWTVSYVAQADGVYYANVRAIAAPNDGPTMARAYAARLEIGDMSKAQKVEVPGILETGADGETMIVMEAEETIE